MRVTVLGSGSQGNATLFEAGNTRVLVDAGIPVGELKSRIENAHGTLPAIDGVILTHAHGDHVRHVDATARASCGV